MTLTTTLPCQHSSLIPDYVSGKLSTAAADDFDSHVEHCSVCCEQLIAAVEKTPGPPWISLAQSAVGLHTEKSTLSHRLAGASAATVNQTGAKVVVEPVFSEEPAASVRYSWLRRIGSGGMGDVWEGWDHLMERSVALKRLGVRQAHFDGVQRLMQEALALARLSHPNIISVYEVVTDEDQPVLVMEYVRGMTLSQWHSGRPLVATEAAEICHTLAIALHHAHRHGVIHRDVKPSNVLLRTDICGVLPRRENGSPDLQLSDFGLARIIDDPTLTRTGQIMGTPSYMAPEQISAGQTVDARTDVYSLGVILYELLTGRPPFAASEAVKVLEMIRTLDPLRPRVLQPHVAKDIETICLKCLERDPGRRYGSAEAVAEDLLAFLQHRPVRARPVSRLQRAVRWVTRNRAFAALALLTVAALTFAFVAAIRTANFARQQARLEREGREQAQAMLLDAISIVDNYMHLIGEPQLPLTPVTSETRMAAIGQTLDVYRDYIRNIQPAEVLSPEDLRIVCRFLELQRYGENFELVEQCLGHLDASLKAYKLAPADPELIVDALLAKHTYFAPTEAPDDTQTRIVAEWLEYGGIFLQQARLEVVEPSRRSVLLRACRATFIHAVISLSTTPPGPGRLRNLTLIANAAAAAASELEVLAGRSGHAAAQADPGNGEPQKFSAWAANRTAQRATDAEAILLRISGDVSTEAAAAESRIETTALLSLIRGTLTAVDPQSGGH